MEEPPEFERLLHEGWEAGRVAWPRLTVSGQDFMRYLWERLSQEERGQQLAEVLKERKQGDLYLACACVLKVPGAFEELEAHHLSKLPALLRYLHLPDADLQDVCQEVRIQVLMGTTKSPRIAEYRGRGTLLNWLQAIAVRLALKRGIPRCEQAEEHVLDFIERASPSGLDPEIDFIKRLYRAEIQQGLDQARDSLPSRQQYLLKLYLKDRLSTTELGKIFGVSQPTISRWLQKVRDTLYKEMKRRLKERFGISSREFKSLMEIIKSQLDMSFTEPLKDEGKRDEKGEQGEEGGQDEEGEDQDDKEE
jgi:RNA polymerase sigma-70 factor (ECF subfamily)